MPQGVAVMAGTSTTADAELSGAVWVEVLESLGQPARFALRYAVAPANGDLSLLSDARLSPNAVIRIQVPSPDGEVCLTKGLVTGQQIRLVHGGAGSSLEVLGSDSSIRMDRETRTAAFTEGADSDIVNQILNTYGFMVDVEGTSGRRPGDTGPPLVQRETDLHFVQRLARLNGAHFWLDCDTTGVETAHFKRMDLGTEPVRRLVINQNPANLEALELRWDAERPTSTDAHGLDLGTLEVGDGSATASSRAALGARTLQAITADLRSVRLTAPIASSAELTARAEAVLIDAELFVEATGETTAAALGGVLRAHTLVELTGAGQRHSGKYLVTSVRHTIDSTGHRMRFELGRNAWEA